MALYLQNYPGLGCARYDASDPDMGEMKIMNFIDMLNRNRSLFNKMKKLAVRQEKLVETDNIYDFLDITSQRKKIQQMISETERKYDKQKNRHVESGPREKLHQLISEIEEMIIFIRETDKRIEELLENKKDDLSSEIKGFRKGQRAIKGYSGLTVKSPRFIDRKG